MAAPLFESCRVCPTWLSDAIPTSAPEQGWVARRAWLPESLYIECLTPEHATAFQADAPDFGAVLFWTVAVVKIPANLIGEEGNA